MATCNEQEVGGVYEYKMASAFDIAIVYAIVAMKDVVITVLPLSMTPKAAQAYSGVFAVGKGKNLPNNSNFYIASTRLT